MADAPGSAADLIEAAARRRAMQAHAVAESLTLPVGLTPKDAVWRLGPVTLWRYRPTRLAAKRHPVPLLLVYALTNKPYIFDLRPERSFVAYLLDQGFDAWLDRPQARVMWQALHRWVHDGVPFAGEAFRQWVKEYVQQNELARGVHVAAGQRVDLEQITAPLLVIAAEYDHIVPLAQATPVIDLVGSTDTRLEVVRGGHVGIMAGSAGPTRLWPLLSAWLAERSV
ncbi:MAG: hypothetical protein AAF624_04685 [Bacteroidota bacterium]